MIIENKNILTDIAQVGEYHRKNGGKIDINRGIPYIAITDCTGNEWFLQGEEAQNLLDEIPDNVNEEDYIFWISRGW